MRRNRAALILIAVCAIGCGGSIGDLPDKFEVTGSVTFDGEPVEDGAIVFDSADGQSTPVGGAIVDGKYSVEVPAGRKLVRISASRETGEKDMYGEPIVDSYVPGKYNTESDLERTVEPGGDNAFDFELEAE